jgi:hypothetical protein
VGKYQVQLSLLDNVHVKSWERARKLLTVLFCIGVMELMSGKTHLFVNWISVPFQQLHLFKINKENGINCCKHLPFQCMADQRSLKRVFLKPLIEGGTRVKKKLYIVCTLFITQFV